MARKAQENPQLDMTPMIDVVFELIIFFVVTIKQQDVLSKLNVNRPAPAKSSSSSEQEDEPCKIDIGRDRSNSTIGTYIIGSDRTRTRTLEEVDEYLKGIAAKSSRPEQTPIIISCEMKSYQRSLIRLLDCCYKHKLYSISVFSM